ncbi:hypothetical protein BBP40_005931 [Aspergillus hancockii]|nr:hypothetical protein BBP40_005931 [Aspergillus hancockii]
MVNVLRHYLNPGLVDYASWAMSNQMTELQMMKIRLIYHLDSSPSSYWQQIKQKAERVLRQKINRNWRVKPDDTSIVVSVNDRSQRDLTESFTITRTHLARNKTINSIRETSEYPAS